MKRSQIVSVTTRAALLLAAAQLFVTVDATAQSYKKADKTGASIAEFRDEIVSVKKEADATMQALDKIVVTADTDPRKAFREFDKAVPKLDAAANKAKKRASDIKAAGQAYFTQWEKELSGVASPEVRQLAQERKAKLQETFGQIRTVMEPARDQFNTWLTEVKDLQKYLGSDLTIAGIDAAKALIAKCKTDGHAVQTTLDAAIAELNTVVATITPAKTKK